MAELRWSLASWLAGSVRCPLLRPPTLAPQDVLCCTSDGMLRTGGGAPTPWNEDNGPLSGATEPLFVGVGHTPEPSQLASRRRGQESGSTCSLEGHQVRRVRWASGSDLYSGRLRLYCWSAPSDKDLSPRSSEEPGTGHTEKGLAGPGQPLDMHFGSAMSLTSRLGCHRHSKWNQTLLCKMELPKNGVVAATEPEFHPS